jgi:hypothetical protein
MIKGDYLSRKKKNSDPIVYWKRQFEFKVDRSAIIIFLIHNSSAPEAAAEWITTAKSSAPTASISISASPSAAKRIAATPTAIAIVTLGTGAKEF